MLRAFGAPKSFARTLTALSITLEGAAVDTNRYAHSEADGASVPALGLSNKAVTSGANADDTFIYYRCVFSTFHIVFWSFSTYIGFLKYSTGVFLF